MKKKAKKLFKKYRHKSTSGNSLLTEDNFNKIIKKLFPEGSVLRNKTQVKILNDFVEATIRENEKVKRINWDYNLDNSQLELQKTIIKEQLEATTIVKNIQTAKLDEINKMSALEFWNYKRNLKL